MLAALVADNAQQYPSLVRLRALVRDRLTLLADTRDLARGGDAAAATAIVRSGRGAALMREVAAEIDRMRLAEMRLLEARTARADRYRTLGWVAIAALGGLAIVLSWTLRHVAAREHAGLAANERRLATTFASIADGVITTDHGGRVDRMNPAAEQMTGWLGSAARGHCVDEVCSLRAQQREDFTENPARTALRERRPILHPRALCLAARGGIEREVEVSAAPLFGEQDDLAGVVLVFRDVTELRSLERAQRERDRQANLLLERRVEERTQALQEANAELQAFAHSVAHDLRAPLRNIQGYASAILEDEHERLSEEGALYAHRMAESAVRLDGLIQDLLGYARLARADITLENVHLESLVSRVLADLSNEIAAREAHVDVEHPLPVVRGHRMTLGQVITNLVSNAIKFVAPDRTPQVRIHARRLGEQVSLVVADNGIGIAREHHERIFRVFERLHGSESFPGTGIGLAIVRRGVERMGGHVRVDSRPGSGSRFLIELPAGEPS